MAITLTFLLLIIIIFCYFFFAPFYLEINSIKGLYRARFHQIASADLTITNNSLLLEIKIMGWIKQVDLLAKEKIKKEKRVGNKKTIKKEGKGLQWKKVKNILASFQVNNCIISFDSGNMQLNGILYPLFYWLSIKSGKNIQVNFMEKNEIILEIENNLARMSWAYISS